MIAVQVNKVESMYYFQNSERKMKSFIALNESIIYMEWSLLKNDLP